MHQRARGVQGQIADEPVAWDEVVRLVGKPGIAQFSKLWDHLGYPLPGENIAESLSRRTVRFAPSVIARGEIQLFCKDIPRFVLRAYLGERDKSFINLRRMTELNSRMKSAKWLSPRDAALGQLRGQLRDAHDNFRVPSAKEIVEHLKDGGGRRMQTAHAVADGVIVPTSRQCQAYWFAVKEFGWVGGESESVIGVFYVSILDDILSGATCGAACAVMISAHVCAGADAVPHAANSSGLKFGITPGLHGLADIGAIISPEQYQHIQIGNLQPEALFNYFLKLNKPAFIRIAMAEENPQALDSLVAGAIETLRTYVRSGFPCVLFVRDQDSRPSHTVVVVGARKESSAAPFRVANKYPAELYVNDPSHYPMDPWDRKIFSDRAVFQDEDGLYYTTQFVVLPDEVRVPFNRSYSSARNETYAPNDMGVFEMAEVFNADMEGHAPSQFILGRTYSDPDDASVVTVAAYLREFCGNDFFHLWNADPALKELRNRWIWFERISNCIRLWDAQRSPLPGPPDLLKKASVLNHVLGTAEKEPNGIWRFDVSARGALPASSVSPYLPRYGRIPSPDPDDKRARANRNSLSSSILKLLHLKSRKMPEAPLTAGLITSTFPTTLRASLSKWPGTVSSGDLYAFMHRDEEILEPIWADMHNTDRLNPPSIVEVLSHAYKSTRRDRLVGEVCKRIQKVRKETGADLTFRAMATFISSLFATSPGEGRMAIEALCACSHIANHLNTHYRDEIRIIEIVGGSRVEGLISLPGSTPENSRVYALRAPLKQMLPRIEDRLKTLCDSVRSDGIAGVAFALEIEPGPLFTINGVGPLKEIARLLNKPSLKGMVGLNIDVAHCVLSGIRPDDVFSDAIRDLIYHFHISDHGAGHFADAVIGDCGFNACVKTDADKIERFMDWIWRARTVAKERTGGVKHHIPFSKMISVELEGARFHHDVAASCELLQRLLSGADIVDISNGLV